ncbi:hypothetical protein FF1_012381 [Malus domestica]
MGWPWRLGADFTRKGYSIELFENIVRLHISLVDVLSVILPLLLRLRWKLRTMFDLGETFLSFFFSHLPKWRVEDLFKNALVHSFVWLYVGLSLDKCKQSTVGHSGELQEQLLHTFFNQW